MAQSSSSSLTSLVPLPITQDAQMWDVSEILAERRTVNGLSEVLVVWRPSWIAKDSMDADGPVRCNFRQAPKARFVCSSGLGTLILPVEPGTALAEDCASLATRVQSHNTTARGSLAAASNGAASQQRDRGTRRKSLGGVAK